MKPTIDSVEAVAKCGQTDARRLLDLAARQRSRLDSQKNRSRRPRRQAKSKKI